MAIVREHHVVLSIVPLPSTSTHCTARVADASRDTADTGNRDPTNTVETKRMEDELLEGE